MHKPLNVTSRLIILVIIAVVFSATVIGLSIRHRTDTSMDFVYDQGDKNYDRSFAVQPDGRLIIKADGGNITITGTDRDEVTVHVITRGSSKKLKYYDVTFNQDGNTVTVRGEMKRKHFGFFTDGWVDVQYEINVPKKFNCNLNTAGGNIGIDEVSGRIEGGTSGGNLELSGLSGSIEMSTSGGNVNLNKISGTTDIETSGGNMDADEITGPLRLRTSGGNIEVRNADGNLRAETSGGHIRAIMKHNQGINLSTSGGDITLELPKNAAANVRAETSDGSISCDLEYSGKIREGRMDAKINGGGEEVQLETSGGDIVISQNDRPD